MRNALFLVALSCLMGLAGCDQLGIESATVTAEKRSAEGKAVGAACRHAGRAIEDCYALNKKAEKAAIYAGWREMDDYMRENKIEPVTPQIAPGPRRAKDEEDGGEAVAQDAPASQPKAGAEHAKPAH